jgi:uncharacterized protein (TIGR02270 family)
VPRAPIADILEEHVEEAAFLWTIREASAIAPHYRLADLAGLDDRIEAHLDGLRIAGDHGWAACEAALAKGEPGAIFATAVLAGGEARFAVVLDAAGDAPASARALSSALGWLPFDRARSLIAPLLAPSAPAARRRLGIAACAAHREDPGEALIYGLLDDDPRLSGRALRAAGELGRADLLPSIRSRLGAGDAACRFWAAWSGALLGDAAATPVLWAFADEGGPFAERACAAAVRRTEVLAARERLEALGAWPDHARAAAIGAGVLGDPALAAWLLERMRVPALARVAGEAFAALTGLAIEKTLEGRAPEGFQAGPSDDPADPAVAMDPDLNLPWPEPDAVHRAWAARSDAFRRGVRHIEGAPMSADGLERALRDASQRQRASAAVELAMRRAPAGSQPLFETRAPAPRQRRALGQSP